MNFLAARKAFAAYQPDSFDERGFVRPDLRLAEILAVSGGHVEPFRAVGRYPNPMRFSFRDRQIRYVTDDLELLVMKNCWRNTTRAAYPKNSSRVVSLRPVAGRQ